MEEKKKGNKGLVALVIILLLACIGMGVFIFINKDKLTAKENATKTVESDKNDTNEKTEITTEKANTIETRKCTGVYTGTAALTQDVHTGQYGKGTLTIELKSDGTYELKKENMNGTMGNYTIIENTLLLKTSPETTGPGGDTSAKYSEYLNISNDCSTISWGYGSYFFDPNFTLTKNN
jgi:cytoskeletal protein RodZ